MKKKAILGQECYLGQEATLKMAVRARLMRTVLGRGYSEEEGCPDDRR